MQYISPLKNKQNNNLGKKVAIVLVIVSSICYFALFTNLIWFLKSFLLGFFGVFSYPLFFCGYAISYMLFKGKKFVMPKRFVVYIVLAIFSLLGIFHLAFSGFITTSSYGAYLSEIYLSKSSVGGLLMGLFTYPLIISIQPFGAYVVFGILLIISGYKIIDFFLINKNSANFLKSNKKSKTRIEEVKISTGASNFLNEQLFDDKTSEKTEKIEPKITVDAEIQKEDEKRLLAKQKLGLTEIRGEKIKQNVNSQIDTFEKVYGAKNQTPIFDDFNAKNGQNNDIFNAQNEGLNNAFYGQNGQNALNNESYGQNSLYSNNGYNNINGLNNNFNGGFNNGGDDNLTTFDAFNMASFDSKNQYKNKGSKSTKQQNIDFLRATLDKDYHKQTTEEIAQMKKRNLNLEDNLKNLPINNYLNQNSGENLDSNLGENLQKNGQIYGENYAKNGQNLHEFNAKNNDFFAKNGAKNSQNSFENTTNLGQNFERNSNLNNSLNAQNGQNFDSENGTKNSENFNNLNEDFSATNSLNNQNSMQNNNGFNQNNANINNLNSQNENKETKNGEKISDVKIDDLLNKVKNMESEQGANFKEKFKQTNLLEKKGEPTKATYKKPSKYVYPTTNLLNSISTDASKYCEDYQEKGQIIERTLENFKVPAKVIGVTCGPSVTRFELEMPPGISVNKINQYSNDIAMALASPHGVRIEAPIPGKSAVGVEVPNNEIATVGLREVLESKEFYGAKGKLTFALGKDINGTYRVCNMEKMPHLLIAGSTGSGKSVCLNVLLVSLLYKCSPEDLRIVLVDPKRVEFSMFNNLPHLLIPEVICSSDKAINALNYLIKEMERRYELFEELYVKKLEEYNETKEVASGEKEKLPYIIMIIDEMNDLMSTNKKEIEDRVVRIAQKARAAGIHLILATQRPSVDVITGTIKTNLPSRIAFAVTSFIDSKTILDRVGAEKLLGKGDMLYYPQDLPEPSRIQCAFVSNDEVKSVISFIKQNNESVFSEEAEREINKSDTKGAAIGFDPNELDSLLPEALKHVIEVGSASISNLQRRFGIGFSRAGKIIDQMERLKYISPADGSRARTVYLTMDEYREKYGD